MSELATLFQAHIDERQRSTAQALADTAFEALVISSGKVYTHFADDQDAPFHPTPHFAHWCPVAGPHHLLVLCQGRRPRLIRFAPEDFWYEQAPLGNPFWASAFDIEEVGSVEDAWKALGALPRAAYIGNETDRAEAAGLALNPTLLTAHLDWHRTTKSPYEVACIEEATVIAARGHQAAREAFLAGGSELEIHYTYIQAAGLVDHEMPYGSIVGLNEKGAILHYEGKRADVRNGQVLLIDAGAQVRRYAADITRTVAAPHCHPTFQSLVQGMERVELALCDQVKPGLAYGDLHHQGHLLIADLLQAQGILKAGPEEALEKGLSRPFFPHGLGHHHGLVKRFGRACGARRHAQSHRRGSGEKRKIVLAGPIGDLRAGRHPFRPHEKPPFRRRKWGSEAASSAPSSSSGKASWLTRAGFLARGSCGKAASPVPAFPEGVLQWQNRNGLPTYSGGTAPE